MLSVIKCTDDSSLVAPGKYSVLEAQTRKKRLESAARFSCLKKALAKTTHSPSRIVNTVSRIAAEDDWSLFLLTYPRLRYGNISLDS